MQIKIFGKALFEISKGGFGQVMFNTVISQINKSEYLPDFYLDTGGYLDTFQDSLVVKKVEVEITPKDVYTLKTLDDVGFKIKVDPKYIDEQIQQFKDKFEMIKSKDFDMNRGTVEIGSILKRMENRKLYLKHKKFFEEFPYTSTLKIKELVKQHNHLKIGEVSQFLADMPQEAVDVMKKYTAETIKLCGKKPAYYIIANKKDFKKSESRRDPILLAQSPFGHFWQILGAWDEEMLLIEEL